MRTIFLFILLLAPVSAGRVAAQDVSQLSETAVAAALQDVAGMKEAELRSLLEYLAQCDDRNSRASVQPCKAARFKYTAIFGRGRQIDKTLESMEQVFSVREAIIGAGINPNKPTPMTELSQRIARATGEALRAKTNQ